MVWSSGSSFAQIDGGCQYCCSSKNYIFSHLTVVTVSCLAKTRVICVLFCLWPIFFSPPKGQREVYVMSRKYYSLLPPCAHVHEDACVAPPLAGFCSGCYCTATLIHPVLSSGNEEGPVCISRGGTITTGVQQGSTTGLEHKPTALKPVCSLPGWEDGTHHWIWLERSRTIPPEGQCTGQEGICHREANVQVTSHRQCETLGRGGPSDKLPHRDVKADAQRSLGTHTEPQSRFLSTCAWEAARVANRFQIKWKKTKSTVQIPRCRSHVSSLQCGQYHTG